MPLNPKDAVAVSEIRWRGKGLATYRESPSVPLSCTRCSVSSHWRSAEKIVLIRLLMCDSRAGACPIMGTGLLPGQWGKSSTGQCPKGKGLPLRIGSSSWEDSQSYALTRMDCPELDLYLIRAS